MNEILFIGIVAATATIFGIVVNYYIIAKRADKVVKDVVDKVGEVTVHQHELTRKRLVAESEKYRKLLKKNVKEFEAEMEIGPYKKGELR